MGVTEDLIRIKKQIEDARTEKARLEGREAETMARLKAEFAVSTVEEAKALRDRMRADLDELEGRIERGVSALAAKLRGEA